MVLDLDPYWRQLLEFAVQHGAYTGCPLPARLHGLHGLHGLNEGRPGASGGAGVTAGPEGAGSAGVGDEAGSVRARLDDLAAAADDDDLLKSTAAFLFSAQDDIQWRMLL